MKRWYHCFLTHFQLFIEPPDISVSVRRLGGIQQNSGGGGGGLSNMATPGWKTQENVTCMPLHICSICPDQGQRDQGPMGSPDQGQRDQGPMGRPMGSPDQGQREGPGTHGEPRSRSEGPGTHGESRSRSEGPGTHGESRSRSEGPGTHGESRSWGVQIKVRGPGTQKRARRDLDHGGSLVGRWTGVKNTDQRSKSTGEYSVCEHGLLQR